MLFLVATRSAVSSSNISSRNHSADPLARRRCGDAQRLGLVAQLGHRGYGGLGFGVLPDVPGLMLSCAPNLGQAPTCGGAVHDSPPLRSAARTARSHSARISGFSFATVAAAIT
jgi:hypothetical protein